MKPMRLVDILNNLQRDSGGPVYDLQPGDVVKFAGSDKLYLVGHVNPLLGTCDHCSVTQAYESLEARGMQTVTNVLTDARGMYNDLVMGD